MANIMAFEPAWASPPGATIAELLEAMDLSVEDFADQLGWSPKRAEHLISGEAGIDGALASRLSEVLGASPAFWLNRESQYRISSARLNAEERILDTQDWLKQFPLRDMTSFGWIKTSNTAAAKTAACLEFFDVPDVSAWQKKYGSTLSVAAFRTSPSFEANPAAVSAWLRWGEIQAQAIECAPWDSARFRDALQDIRPLTRQKDPSVFLPLLRRICAACGVAVVIARAPSGCRASGATRFLTAEKAMIILSFRYLTDDHFWFTFFHEAGHLLLHGEDALFLEDNSQVTSVEEEEANEFAARTLVPQKHLGALSRLRLERREIIGFARLVGVAPGIIVGQLQHTKRIPPSRFNTMKRRLTWTKQQNAIIP